MVQYEANGARKLIPTANTMAFFTSRESRITVGMAGFWGQTFAFFPRVNRAQVSSLFSSWQLTCRLEKVNDVHSQILA